MNFPESLTTLSGVGLSGTVTIPNYKANIYKGCNDITSPLTAGGGIKTKVKHTYVAGDTIYLSSLPSPLPQTRTV